MVRKFRRMIKSKSILKKKRGKTMKKFTKIMLSVAAVTAVSTAMAISAMAEDTVTGTYAPETGVVTLDGVVSSGDQQTLLVLTEDAATVTEGIIAQIDQDAAISQFVLPANIESGTYYIRIGGTDGTIQTGTLTIGSQGGGDAETVTIIVGDVDAGGDIGGRDGVFLARYLADYTTNIGDAGVEKDVPGGSKIIIGDVDAGGDIGGRDGVFLARYLADYTTNIGDAGKEAQVLK